MWDLGHISSGTFAPGSASQDSFSKATANSHLPAAPSIPIPIFSPFIVDIVEQVERIPPSAPTPEDKEAQPGWRAGIGTWETSMVPGKAWKSPPPGLPDENPNANMDFSKLFREREGRSKHGFMED